MEKDQESLLTDLATFFDANTIPYMITGAWSVIFYGRPRASHDIDFVVELFPRDVTRVLAAIKKLSEEFSVQPESIKEGIQEKSLFQIFHKESMLKIDAWLLTDDPFDQSRFSRKMRVLIFGKHVYIASAEDTILQKLRWYKEAKLEKHLVDAAFVYQIQGKQLNTQYIAQWAKKLGVEKFLKTLGKIDLTLFL